MTKNQKIFFGIVLGLFVIFEFLNFELAVDSQVKSTANQKIIDSLETKIAQIEESLNQKQDTVIINNYITIKQPIIKDKE